MDAYLGLAKTVITAGGGGTGAGAVWDWGCVGVGEGGAGAVWAGVQYRSTLFSGG